MDSQSKIIGRDLKLVFWLVGLLTFIVGAAMFLAPEATGVGSVAADGTPIGDQLWPWPLRTNLNTRFLGALFVGVGVGAFWAARQHTWAAVRGLFLPGLTFTALATIAAFISWSSFPSTRITTWVFFGLYIAVLIAGTLTYMRYERHQR